jgi:uncharacterized lipoprotein YajG
MPQQTRAVAGFLVAVVLVAGCSRAAREPRVSETQMPPQATAASTAVAPLPGHPPVTTSGVVAKFDSTNGVMIFQDGRTVRLTDQSQIVAAKTKQPIDPRAVRPGDRVVVQNALPVGLSSVAKGKRQRAMTVASVDQQNQLVRMTDGSTVRVTPSTRMTMGPGGQTIVLTDLRPGDELIIVMEEVAPAVSSSSAGTQTSMNPGSRPTTTGSPSELPRNVITGAPSDPSDASELIMFREAEAP